MQLANDNYRLLQPRPYPARLSLVIPMYNEGLVVPFLTSGLEQFMGELRGEAEVVLVNDGSTDSTLKKSLNGRARTHA
jgi:glycosyltransferase involved in cell wall biosynthesis